MNWQHPFAGQPRSHLTGTSDPRPGFLSAAYIDACLGQLLLSCNGHSYLTVVTAPTLQLFTCHKLLALSFKRKELGKKLGGGGETIFVM